LSLIADDYTCYTSFLYQARVTLTI